MTREEFLTLLPELVKNYQPSEEALKKISKVALLMVIGPSGAGKTTLINHCGLPYVPSDTTRLQRLEEIDGVDYHFREDYSQLADDIRNGRFVQVAIGSGGDFYATRDTSYPEAGAAVMAIVADVIPEFRKLGFKKTIGAFIVPPSYDEWQRRLRVHDLSPEQLSKRLSEGKRSLQFAVTDPEVHLILNDNVDIATKQLEDIVDGHLDVKMEEKAKAAAQNLLTRLELINT